MPDPKILTGSNGFVSVQYCGMLTILNGCSEVCKTLVASDESDWAATVDKVNIEYIGRTYE